MKNKITYTIIAILSISFFITNIALAQEQSFCTSDTGNIMTFSEAEEITRNSSCASVGEIKEGTFCSGNLINVPIEPIVPGCFFQCRIDIDTGEAHEGLMCTGGITGPLVPYEYLIAFGALILVLIAFFIRRKKRKNEKQKTILR